jgi:hypothetical protein
VAAGAVLGEHDRAAAPAADTDECGDQGRDEAGSVERGAHVR